jgi:hypothetical protein
VWREDVDSEELCCTFDLALGFFSGMGLYNDTACELANQIAAEEIVNAAGKAN